MMLKEKLKKWFFPILLIGIIILAGLSIVRRTHVVQVYVVLPNEKVILTDVADSPEDHILGLFLAGSLPVDRGVLLIYEEAGLHRLWGRNIRSPVDIIWLDPTRKIIQIDKSVSPCMEEPCPIYEPREAVLFVFQVAPGVASENGLEPGVSLEFRKVRS